MKIEYCLYNEEFITDIEPDKIHIFPKPRDMNLAKNRYIENINSSNIFLKQPKFIKLSDFIESVFLANKIVLKKEKRSIAFYQSLSTKNRKKLRIDSYQDSISISNQFFDFFKLLKENKIEKIDILKKWQQKTENLFLDIKSNYLDFLKSKNFTDSIFIITDLNYNSSSYDGFEKIVIYNKLYFTPLEKWIIAQLEKDGFEILLKLQIDRKDFCEKSLSLKEIKIRDEHVKFLDNIELFTVNDEFMEFLKVLDIRDKISITNDEAQNIEILDCNHNNFRYNSFFNDKKTFEHLPIFSLLEGIYQILDGLEVIDSELTLNLYEVVETIKLDEIYQYYNISEIEIQQLKIIIQNGYKYLTKNKIRELFSEESFLNKIFCHIEKISRYKYLKEWVKELSNLGDKSNTLFINNSNIDKYVETLSELLAIEDLDVVSSWKDFFSDEKIAAGLLKLILDSLKLKTIKDKKNQIKKESLDNINTTPGINRIFINMSDLYIPNIKQTTFLFTESQKQALGIKTVEECILEEKYNFFRAVLTSKKSIVIAIQNVEINSSLSSFVEEIIEIAKIKALHLKQYPENYIDLITSYKNKKISKNIDNNSSTEVKVMNFKPEELKNPIFISAYMCDEMFNCQYKMYLRYIERLNSEELKIDRHLTKREYGVLAHELFEKILKQINKTQNYSIFKSGIIEINFIRELLKKLIRNRQFKLPLINKKYYEEIIYENLINSINLFFNKISQELKNENVIELLVEQNLSKGFKNSFIEVIGRAKADLIIRTDKNSYIIDFKTGKLNVVQLDFYSILYGEKVDSSKKYIYNITNGSLEESENIKLVKNSVEKKRVDPEDKKKSIKILEDELEELMKTKIYAKNITSKCSRCEYINVCKVGEM